VWGGVDGGVKVDPLCIFLIAAGGSEILAWGFNPPTPPSNTALVGWTKDPIYWQERVDGRPSGRWASEEVVLQLIKSKCVAVLLYGLEPFDLFSTDLKYLDFVINRLFYEIV